MLDNVELARKKADLLKKQNDSNKLNPLLVYWYQFLSSIGWIYDKFLDPFLNPFARTFKWIYNKYRLLWQKITYKNGKFSRARGGVMIICTWFFVWFCIVPILDLFSDTTLYTISYALGHKDEKVYLTGSQEVTYMHDQNIHAIKGCHDLPCNSENSIYFRTQFSLFNLIWSLSTGNGWYWPEAVAAAVPNQVSSCVITSYGLRFKWLTRGLEIYPDILAVECQPIGVTK